MVLVEMLLSWWPKMRAYELDVEIMIIADVGSLHNARHRYGVGEETKRSFTCRLSCIVRSIQHER